MPEVRNNSNDIEQFITLRDIHLAFIEASDKMSSRVPDIRDRNHHRSHKGRIYVLDEQGNSILDEKSTELAFVSMWLSKDVKNVIDITENVANISIRRLFSNTPENSIANPLLQKLEDKQVERGLLFDLSSNIKKAIEVQVWSIMKRETNKEISEVSVEEFLHDQESNRVQNASISFVELMLGKIMKDYAERTVKTQGTKSKCYEIEIVDPMFKLAWMTFLSLFRAKDITCYRTTFESFSESLFRITTVNEWKSFSKKHNIVNRTLAFETLRRKYSMKDAIIDDSKERDSQKDVSRAELLENLKGLSSHRYDYIQVAYKQDDRKQLIREYLLDFLNEHEDWSDAPIPLYVNLSEAPSEYCSTYEDAHCSYIHTAIFEELKAIWETSLLYSDTVDVNKQIASDVEKSLEALLKTASDGPKNYIVFLDGFDLIPDVTIKHSISTGWREHFVVYDKVKVLLLSEIKELFSPGDTLWRNVQLAVFSENPIEELTGWSFRTLS